MPFYFAWCGPNQPFDASVIREDERVFAFDLTHQEGNIPTLSIDIRNPHIGLLAPGRAQWVWLSWQRTDEDDPVPLFYGRLVALPTNLLGQTVTLSFLARPDDYLAQKQDIADDLMIEPWYDPIWISQDKFGDPDTVLETYAMTWHVDRISHEVSISDILFGEDGTEEFMPEESFYDTVSISFAQSPQTRVVFEGSVRWTQAGTGVIKLPDVSLSAWNGAQIISDWPKTGDQLHGGWSIEEAQITNYSDSTANNNPTIITIGGGSTTNVPPQIIPGGQTTEDFLKNLTVGDVPTGVTGSIRTQTPLKGPGGAHSVSFTYTNPEKEHLKGDTLSLSESAQYNDFATLSGTEVSQSISWQPEQSFSGSWSWVSYYGLLQTAPSTTAGVTTTNPDGSTSTHQITIPSLFGQIILRYNLSRPHTEKLAFVMNSDIQPIVLLPPDDPINQIKLSMSGADLGLPIDPGGAMPIGDPGRSSFFATDRGQLALQYPMLVARAHLAQAARAAKITFDCTFERALDLSCRKNAVLHDLRLPGGQVTGKITEYHLRVDGDRGELIGHVQIETTIGKGASITLNEGVPTYVEEGYATPGWEFYSGQDIALATGDAIIVMPEIVMPADTFTLPLTFNEAVLAFQVHEGTPVDLVVAGVTATADPTWLEIVLLPVTGQKFETDYNLGNSTVVFPKLIDLAAASSG